MEKKNTNTSPVPVLRWAGGKSWLLKHLGFISKLRYVKYHEPFFGGGAVYFFVNPPNGAHLSDLNAALIETYTAIRDNVDLVINNLRLFSNTEDDYYQIRKTTYGTCYERAAQFIYLNQTSFNGIHRVNRDGKFNVPYGFRKKNFLNEAALYAVNKGLQKATLRHGDFNKGLDMISSHDLVFLDPPYTVSHNNNGFIEYNEKIFSLDDQKRLSIYIDQIKEKGAYYILTNAAHETIKDIFDKGDTRLELTRPSLIGGRNAKRGQTIEYVFTNIRI